MILLYYLIGFWHNLEIVKFSFAAKETEELQGK